MILPGIEAVSLHAGRRVTAFPRLISMNRLTKAARINQKADCNGIIRLTITA
jgi:hypothetical protein